MCKNEAPDSDCLKVADGIFTKFQSFTLVFNYFWWNEEFLWGMKRMNLIHITEQPFYKSIWNLAIGITVNQSFNL